MKRPPFGGLSEVVQIPRKSGAGEGARTLDPDLGKVLLLRIPNLLYLIGEAAFVFMAYYAKTDIQVRMRTLLGIGGRQDRGVRSLARLKVDRD